MNFFQSLFTISLLSHLLTVSDVLGFSPGGLLSADLNNDEYREGLNDLIRNEEMNFKDLDGVSNAIADWFVDDTNIPLLTKFPLFVRQNRMSSSNMVPTYAKTFEPNGLASVLQSQNPYRLKRHPSFRLKRASHQSFRLKRISGTGKNILLRVGRRSIKNKI